MMKNHWANQIKIENYDQSKFGGVAHSPLKIESIGLTQSAAALNAIQVFQKHDDHLISVCCSKLDAG